jgi:outer membrane protein
MIPAAGTEVPRSGRSGGSVRAAALLIALLAMLLFGSPALGSEAGVRLSQEQAIAVATRWLMEGRLVEAGELLQALAAAFPREPQVTFLRAQHAMALKDYPRAVTLFRELLSGDPTLLRVRLDLARALFLQGNYDASRYHFELALGQDLPDAARQNVYLFLRQIDTQTTSLTITVLAGRDSNPNNATAVQTVDILGQSFLLNQDARAKSALGVVALVEARRAFGPENRAFVRTSLDLRDYEGSYADYDYAQATLGMSAYAGNSIWTLEAGPVGAVYQNRLLYGGALTQVTHVSPLSDRLMGVQSVMAKHLDYNDYDYLSATEGWLNLQLRYALNPVSRMSAGLSLGRNAARDAAYSYDAAFYSLGYAVELPRRLNVDLRVAFGRYDYDAVQPLFQRFREDRLVRTDLSIVARDWAFRGFAPMLTAGVTHNDSTIDLYDYTRRYLTLGVTRSF